MRVSDSGLRTIARFEGGIGIDGRFHPYKDAAGVWTIGYGHTQDVSEHSTPLTPREALQLLRTDIDHVYAPAVNALHLPLNQNQFEATVSFVYNLGTGVLDSDRTFGELLRQHRWQRAADSMLIYDHAAGKRLPGLTARRRAERAWFLRNPIRRKLAIWRHELEVLRADAHKHGWTKARRIRGRRLKALIAKYS